MRGPGGMTRKDWAFWNTQPVPKFDEVRYLTKYHIFKNTFQEITDKDIGPIEGARENVRKEPYSLPKGFEWDTVNVSCLFFKMIFLKQISEQSRILFVFKVLKLKKNDKSFRKDFENNVCQLINCI